MNVLVKRQHLQRFFDTLRKDYAIIGPCHRKKRTTFDYIDRIDELALDEQTDFSLRKFFLPNSETLFTFKNNTPQSESEGPEKRIIILRPCDANALANIDRIYLDEYPDENYRERRRNTLLFVLKCTTPFKNCFCTSLGTHETTNFDLMFTQWGDKFIVRPGSETGRELTEQKCFAPIIRDGRVTLQCERSLPDLSKLQHHKEDPAWEEAANKCINCNSCISVCPTCMCFSVNDEMEPDLQQGRRARYWDYCHMKDFTRVAGGMVFRENKVNRFRHRIYHKLKYYYEQQGRHLCVGCGRCINTCPADIDMLEVIDKLGTTTDAD